MPGSTETVSRALIYLVALLWVCTSAIAQEQDPTPSASALSSGPGADSGLVGQQIMPTAESPSAEVPDGIPTWNRSDVMRIRNEPEPIAYTGHGAFFDAEGRQKVPTADFVRRAHRWYRSKLVASLEREQRAVFADFEQNLVDELEVHGQNRLLLEQRALDWLALHAPRTVASPRMRGKLGLLRYRLQWQLAPSDDPEHLRRLDPFTPDRATLERITEVDAELQRIANVDFLVTTNSGQAYIDECIANGVPIPPAIGVMDSAGTAGWRSLGQIPQSEQFVISTPAELRSFESPAGLCLALPRYTDTSLSTVQYDGVICQSRVTGKVCFWDNRMSGLGVFQFQANEQIPIGVADLGVNPNGLYQGGGAELQGGDVCSDCHAGENAFVVHPQTTLSSGLLFGSLGNTTNNLPMFAPDDFDPIVVGSWPQNALSQALNVPSVCAGCHSKKGESAGRFPHLSSEIPGYCNTVLAKAITDTMPPANPGVWDQSEMDQFLFWCSQAATAGPSNRGDPHLKTVNGISYDFQAAGELTALRNSATGFELQTRQTGVRTTFDPWTNAHTGLANCASLNTAAAVRLGSHSASVQPRVHGNCNQREEIVLYLDGVETLVPPQGIDLGDGNRIATIGANDGYEFRHSDGTRVLVTDHVWVSEGYSYLNVEVLDTPAREGTMGTIVANDWLPLAPDGSSFGPRPIALTDRDYQLNVTFADAWRISDATSLFVYGPGTSTATFTDHSWPPPNGTSCKPGHVPEPIPHCGPWSAVESMEQEEAEMVCSRFLDPGFEEGIFEECVFDVRLLGNPGMADALEISLAARELPCGTCEPITE